MGSAVSSDAPPPGFVLQPPAAPDAPPPGFVLQPPAAPDTSFLSNFGQGFIGAANRGRIGALQLAQDVGKSIYGANPHDAAETASYNQGLQQLTQEQQQSGVTPSGIGGMAGNLLGQIAGSPATWVAGPMMKPLGVLGGGAVAGGLSGALQPSAGDDGIDTRLARAKVDALGGAAVGGLLHGIGTSVAGAIEPRIAQLVKSASDLGINIPASVFAPGALSEAMGKLGLLPANTMRSDMTTALSQAMGHAGTPNLDVDTMNGIQQALGQRFNNAASNADAAGGIPISQDALDTIAQNSAATPQTVNGLLSRIGRGVGDNGKLSGNAYQELTGNASQLSNAMNSSTDELSDTAWQLRNYLDNQLESTLSPQDLADFRQARTQYRTMKILQPLTEGGGVEGQPDSGAKLFNAVRRNYGSISNALKYNPTLGTVAQIANEFPQALQESGGGGVISNLAKASALPAAGAAAHLLPAAAALAPGPTALAAATLYPLAKGAGVVLDSGLRKAAILKNSLPQAIADTLPAAVGTPPPAVGTPPPVLALAPPFPNLSPIERQPPAGKLYAEQEAQRVAGMPDAPAPPLVTPAPRTPLLPPPARNIVDQNGNLRPMTDEEIALQANPQGLLPDEHLPAAASQHPGIALTPEQIAAQRQQEAALAAEQQRTAALNNTFAPADAAINAAKQDAQNKFTMAQLAQTAAARNEYLKSAAQATGVPYAGTAVGDALLAALKDSAGSTSVAPALGAASAAGAAGAASAAHASPLSFVQRVAQAESSGNPDAANANSTATGTMQFTNGTWANMVQKYGKQTGITLGMKNNPQAQAVMTQLLANDNAQALSKTLGRQPTNGEVYMAHVLGAQGAAKLIAAQGTNKQAIMLYPNNNVKANRPLFFNGNQPRTVEELYSLLNQKVG